MKAIKITAGMINEDVDQLKELCSFLGMKGESIESEVYYFTNGEGFNYKGFSTNLGSETAEVICDGDYIINIGGKFKLVKSDIAFLVVDSLKADEMEKLLDDIYQSGTLNSDMDKRYREFFNLDN